MSVARVAAAAALMALSAVTAFAKPVTLGAETNLRAAPGIKSDVVTLIPKGETVEVGTCDAGWCEVTWNEKKGFSISRNLGMPSPQAQAAAPQRRLVQRRLRQPSEEVYYDDDEPVVYRRGPGYVVAPEPYYHGYYPYPYGWRGGWGGPRFGYGYGWRGRW